MKWRREELYVARNAQGVIIGVSDAKPNEYIPDDLKASTSHLRASERVGRLRQGGDRYYREIAKVAPNNQERMEIR
jgi:hypothetical protein